MKTNYLKASLFALAAMVACTEFEVIDEPQGSTGNGLLQELSITGKDFQFEDVTRSSVTIGENGASFTWNEDDVIGIFPDKGDQVSFAMEEGAGTQTATFSGGGWALKSSAKYAAYYPHVYENKDLTAIPVSYLGQTQNGNGNTDHIGAYDFMAAGVSTPENGAVAFDMQHLGALVQLTITVPEPSSFNEVTLTSDAYFTETGLIDLTAESPSIIAKTQSNTLKVALNSLTTTEANEKVMVYFMIAPVDLTGSELTITIHLINAPDREVRLIGKNLQAGCAYRFDCTNNMISDYIDEYGINQGQGVEIDGVVWAPVNCGYHKDDYKYGRHYQWGRKYGQGYYGYYGKELNDARWAGQREGPVDISVGESQDNEHVFYYGGGNWCLTYYSDIWNAGSEDNPIKTEYDPCPKGWRVPTYAELNNLRKNYSTGTRDEESRAGFYFTGSTAYNDSEDKVFLWKAGYLRDIDAYGFSRAAYGYYWTSHSSLAGAKALCFYGSNNVGMSTSNCAYGYSVRCVHE